MVAKALASMRRTFNRRSTAPGKMLLVMVYFFMVLKDVRSQDAIRYVTSFDQLQRATIDGVRVIVVTDHLDLTSAQHSGGTEQLLTLADSTEAILVRLKVCDGAGSQCPSETYIGLSANRPASTRAVRLLSTPQCAKSNRIEQYNILLAFCHAK